MFFEVLTVILFLIVIYLWFKNREWEIRFEQKIKEWLEKEETRIRQDAISRSARTLSGKTLEKLIPFLDRFKHDPHDIRWLGDPIDLVIFDGQSTGNPEQITFCEVKSGESKLTKDQNRIRELIEKRKIKWEEFRVG